MSTRSLGSLTIDLIARTFGFEQGMDKASRKAKSAGKEIESAFTASMRTVGAAVAGFVAGLATVDTAIRGFTQSVDFADRMDELSARFKISTETLSEWAYAAKMTGSDIESLAGIIPKFSKTIADAADSGSEAAKTFAAIGISVRDQQGNLRSFQDLLPEVADRFRGLNNETTETALAMQLFGKSGAEFLEFLNLGSDGLREMGETARGLGVVIDTETAASAAEFKDRVDDLRAATQGWFTQISAALLPTLTDLTKEMTDFVKEGGNAASIADSVASSIRDIAEAVRFLGSVGDVFDRIRGGLVGLEKQGNAAFQSLNPFNWNRSDLSRLQAQYQEGTAYVEQGWEAMRAAQEKGAADFQVQLIDPSEGFAGYKAQKRLEDQAKKYQEALNKLFNGGGAGNSPRAGKSDAERETERLRSAYDSLAASLDQQIALFGETSEAAKVRYDVEFGSLVNLEPKLKSYLVYKAEELDALKMVTEQQKAADAEVRRQTEAYERHQEQVKDFISDLQFEHRLLGMSNLEREKEIALRWANVDAMSEEGKRIIEQVEATYQLREQVQIMDGMRGEFQNFFADVLTGTASVKDAFSNMLDSIQSMILNKIAQNWVDQLFGQVGSSAGGSAGGGWFGAIAGLFAGGRASGGMVSPRSFVEVNERGLEMATVRGRDYLLAGDAPVQVTPNHRLGMGGGNGVTVNFNGYGKPDRRTAQQASADMAVAAQSFLSRNGRGGRG